MPPASGSDTMQAYDSRKNPRMLKIFPSDTLNFLSVFAAFCCVIDGSYTISGRVVRASATEMVDSGSIPNQFKLKNNRL